MTMFKRIPSTFQRRPRKKRWFSLKPGQTRGVQTKKKRVIDKNRTEQQASAIISRAKTEAQKLILEARSVAIDIKSKAEELSRQQQKKLFDKQTQIDTHKTLLVQNQARIQTREHYLTQQKKMLEELRQNVDTTQNNYLEAVQKIAELKLDEAKEELFTRLEKRLEVDKAIELKEKEDQIIDNSSELIQEVLVTTMSRGGIDYAHEYKPPIVQVFNKRILHEVKGTNDCNKEFLEKLANVELVFEDEGVIKINSVDSVDREVVRRVLEKLIKGGRINPARIRRVYQQINQELDKQMYEAGRNLCHAVGVYKLPKDIMQKLGKFKFRFSYGQNMIEHTLEETLIGIALAHEFGADSNVVRLGCLFHDIGKVIYDDEGTHVETGVNYLKQQGIPQAVIDCVAQSHEDEPFSSLESIIVHIADGISGARPAARHNDHEFANRVKYLEETPLKYKGVKEAFAIQAGREVRVFVDPKAITDEEIKDLAKKLKDQIKSELTYPGSVTVNVIREVSVSSTISPELKTTSKT